MQILQHREGDVLLTISHFQLDVMNKNNNFIAVIGIQS